MAESDFCSVKENEPKQEKVKMSSEEAVTVIQGKFPIRTETKPMALEIRRAAKLES